MRFPARFLSLVIAAVATLGLPAAAQKRDPLPVPDIPGYKTLKCDFHMHTVFSDGEVWPTTRVVEAWRDGLDAISITDHDDYRPRAEDVKKDISRPYTIAAPVARRMGIILIPGAEITKGDIHFNALFVTEPNRFAGLDLMSALKEGRQQGAFLFWNHPGWRKKTAWFPEIAAAYDAGLFDGIELVNGATFYADAFPWIEEKKLTILSNSDVHTPMMPQGLRPGRPVTLVFSSSADANGIREALKARRTAAWMGGELWGAEQYMRALWMASVQTLDGGRALWNRSAIPFHIKVRRTPPWMTVRDVNLEPESIQALRLTVAKNAPSPASGEVEIEIANVHVAPGKNLTVRVPMNLSK